MVSFKKFILQEKYLNIFNEEDKKKYLDDVWDILQKSYSSLGGIKGRGFENKEMFLISLPFWKLAKKNGKVVAVIIYRDKFGRKIVAVGTDGTEDGKAGLLKIFNEELLLNRSYFEISGPFLKFLSNNMGKDFIASHAFSLEEVKKVLNDESILPVDQDDEHVKMFPLFKQYFYQREIGGHLHTKIMLGRVNNFLNF